LMDVVFPGRRAAATIARCSLQFIVANVLYIGEELMSGCHGKPQ
jgi:hypothetical protein